MAKTLEKEKAIELRLRGNTRKSIAENLNVSYQSVFDWTKDLQLPEEVRKKMINEIMIKRGPVRKKGEYTCSQETKDKISGSKKGKPSWALGLTKETHTGLMRISLGKMNEKNSQWKGDKVKYISLHNWTRRHKPQPELCENCKEFPPYDLANISGNYKRDINDFEWLCRRCHMNKDGRIKNLRRGQCQPCLIT